MLLGGAPEADAPAHPVRAEPGRADPLREPTAADAPQHFELRRSVLTLAETNREDSIVVGFGIDVRNAELIAPNRDWRARPAKTQFPIRNRQPAAKRETKEQSRKTHSEMIRAAGL